MKALELREKPIQDQRLPSHTFEPLETEEGQGALGHGVAELRAERDRLLAERERLRADCDALAAGKYQLLASWKPPETPPQFQDLQSSFKALEKRCSHYVNLYDFAPVGYVIFNAAGQITDINKAGALLVGWEHARLIGHRLADFIAEKDAPKFAQHLQQCRAGAARINTELLLQCKAGSRLPVELVSAPFQSREEAVTYYRTAIIDIKQRRRFAEGLQQLHQDYLALVNALEGIVWEGEQANGGWRFTFVSSQAERLLGFPAQRWMDEQGLWLERLHPQDKPAMLAARAQALASGANYLSEYRMVAANGQIVWLRDIVHATRLPSGQVKLQGVAINITELKDAEQAIRSAYRELEHRVLDRTAALTRTCQQLRQSLAERQRLEHEILDTTERERRRLGLDLHDELGQRLVGSALMAKSLQTKLAKQAPAEAGVARDLYELLSQIMQQAHDLSHDLTAWEIEEELPAALTVLTQRAEKLFGIPCDLHVPPALPPLGQNAVRHLYKITQEAVTNAIKHGRAKRVRVQVALAGDQLQLTISNQGRPFPKLLKSQHGLGLRTMGYRANILGATLEVRPGGKRGAVVSCVMPVRPLEAEALA
jgi:PAS domain S-box-containing protein